MGRCIPAPGIFGSEPIEVTPSGYWTDAVVPLPPQLDELQELLCPPGSSCTTGTQLREIDTLIMATGPNDLFFGKVVAECAQPNVFNPDISSRAELGSTDCDENPTRGSLEGLVRLRLEGLPGHFDEVGRRLDEGFQISQTLLLEAPDMIRDADGDICESAIFRNAVEDKLTGSFRDQLILAIVGSHGVIDRDELEWANRTVYEPAIREQAAAANRNDWTLVEAPEFSTSGYCTDSSVRLVNTYTDSNQLQGDRWGTFHPNKDGHQVYKEHILNEISLP